MRLSTMKKVVDTLDEEWRSPLGEQILERWGYDPGTVKYFRSSANFVFVFRKNGRLYFLRFNDACERELETIKAEIDVLQYLKSRLLHTAQPVKSLNDRYIEVIDTDLGTFYAVVFEGLEGEQPEFEELTAKQFFTWGKALGQLHKAFKNMPSSYRQNRPSWETHLAFVKETLPAGETSARKELERVAGWAKDLTPTEENCGLIHYDFEPDNLVWHHNQVGILDFDDAACYSFVADIAYALRDLFEDGIDLENPLFKKFMEGYQNETAHDLTMLRDLPWFMRMHDLVSFAKLLRSVDLSEAQSGPLSDLRKKLVHLIENCRTSFEKLALK